eukprot:257347_1
MFSHEALQIIKYVDQRSKDTVNGFIREFQSILPNNIPPLINHICLVFYAPRDIWDNQHISKKMQLIDESCITKISDDWDFCSAFGKNIIESGQFHWKFRIEKVQAVGLGWYIVLGIWKIKSENKPPVHTYFTHNGDKGAYAFVTDSARLVSRCGGTYRKIQPIDINNRTDIYENRTIEYGIQCKTGDIIDMYLDLNELSLSFAINNHDYGTAFEIENTAYRMAVNMQQKGDSLRIL